MKKVVFFLVSYCFIFGLFFFHAVLGKFYGENTLKIGLLAPFSGDDDPTFGEDAMAIMHLAIEQAGATKYKYRIISGNVGDAGSQTISQAIELLSEKKVHLLLVTHISFRYENTIAELASKEKILALAMCENDGVQQSREYFYNFCPQSQTFTNAELKNILNAKYYYFREINERALGMYEVMRFIISEQEKKDHIMNAFEWKGIILGSPTEMFPDSEAFPVPSEQPFDIYILLLHATHLWIFCCIIFSFVYLVYCRFIGYLNYFQEVEYQNIKFLKWLLKIKYDPAIVVAALYPVVVMLSVDGISESLHLSRDVSFLLLEGGIFSGILLFLKLRPYNPMPCSNAKLPITMRGWILLTTGFICLGIYAFAILYFLMKSYYHPLIEEIVFFAGLLSVGGLFILIPFCLVVSNVILTLVQKFIRSCHYSDTPLHP